MKVAKSKTIEKKDMKTAKPKAIKKKAGARPYNRFNW